VENKSLVELNAMTKAQLISEITKDRTTTECIVAKDSPEGQLQRTFVTKDVSGNVLKTEDWIWSYNKGVVNEIQHVVKNDKSVVSIAEKIVHDNTGVKLVALAEKDIIIVVGVEPIDIKPVEEPVIIDKIIK
jgi:hypothetical protein